MITLKEVAEMMGSELTYGKTVDGGVYASLDTMEIRQGGIRIAATGFGKTRPQARRRLARRLRGQLLISRTQPFGIRFPKRIQG